MTLPEWINSRLSYIAKLLPQLTHDEPASFACGYNAGYKNALLDIQGFLKDEDKSISFYHCGHCTEEVCMNIKCPVCGGEDEIE